MVSFITLSGSLFITLSAKSLLHYRGGCLLHYRLNLLHYREVLHYQLIFITLSGSITLSGVYYIIGCDTHCLYKQDIDCTKWQITSIIKENGTDSKLFLFLK